MPGLNKETQKYLDAKFAGIDDRFESIAVATKLAADSLDARLESMNHTWNTLKEQAAASVQRTVCESRHETVAKSLKELEKWQALMDGKASQESVQAASKLGTWGILIGVGSLFVSLVGIVIIAIKAFA